MGQIHYFLASTMIFVGLLMLAMALPLIKGKVKMNALYGVRTAKTYQSEANWYAINTYGGKQLAGAAVFLLMAGIVLFFIPLRNQILTIGVGFLPALVLIPVMINIIRFSNKL